MSKTRPICPKCEAYGDRDGEYGFIDCPNCGHTWEDENSRLTQENRSYYDEDCDFADPGGRSALRAASLTNPRNLPCPTCGKANRLTPKDVALGYQCDECADRDEGLSGY